MVACTHRFMIRLSRADGTVLCDAPADTDWSPVIEWTHFDGIRKGQLPAETTIDGGSVSPLWAADQGEPQVGGVRVEVRSAKGAAKTWTCDIPISYLFKDVAQHQAAELVESGALTKGETYHYTVSGFPAAPKSEDRAPSFLVKETSKPLSLIERPLAPLLRQAVHMRDECADTADYPVFVSERVLDDASRLALDAFPREGGGILIGHLARDAETQDLYTYVSALIPALLAEAQITRLTFTPDTWTAVRTAIDLRKHGEQWCGWQHSHPAREWCKSCSPESRKVCPLAKDYFSAEDATVHRTVFSRASNVALVTNVTDDGITFSMFGWRRGSVKSRSFYVLKDGTF